MDFETFFSHWADILKVSAGALGMLIIGFYKAKIDNKKIRFDDRALFTEQLIKRLADVERLMEEQRVHYEDIISGLSERIQHLEDKPN